MAPQSWSFLVLFRDRSSYPLVSLCFFCPLNSVWPFLCSTVFQTCSAHAVTFLSNTFLLWQISVQSTEEPWACSGLTLLLCSLFWWLSGWYLSLAQGEEWAQSVNVQCRADSKCINQISPVISAFHSLPQGSQMFQRHHIWHFLDKENVSRGWN